MKYIFTICIGTIIGFFISFIEDKYLDQKFRSFIYIPLVIVCIFLENLFGYKTYFIYLAMIMLLINDLMVNFWALTFNNVSKNLTIIFIFTYYITLFIAVLCCALELYLGYHYHFN